MATEIVMPRLSDSMEEGTVLSWLKSVGDEVALGEELVEIETDKANMVFEADAAGTLIEIVAAEGDTLPIGEVIARVGEASEAPSGEGSSDEAGDGDGTKAPSEEGSSGEPEDADRGSSAIPAPRDPRVDAADAPPDASDSSPTQPRESEPPTAPTSTETPVAQPGAEGDGDGRVKASPLARRIARETGVDLHSLRGSGPGGRIIKADVEAAPAGEAAAEEAPAAPEAPPSPQSAKGEVETVELSKLQQTIARRMSESKATAPHFYLQAQIDMSRAFEARAELKAAAAEGEAVPSFNDMVVKACALALGQFPRANGAYRDGRWELYERINVGIAVAAPGSLVVPTIFDADRKGLRRIATEARELATKVKEKTITPPELSGATFTVSNLGMFGVSNFHPVLNAPQAAILAVGEIAETPVIRDGELESARLMGVSLACDHRILYGADGAEFLARVRVLLEQPLGLAL